MAGQKNALSRRFTRVRFLLAEGVFLGGGGGYIGAAASALTNETPLDATRQTLVLSLL